MLHTTKQKFTNQHPGGKTLQITSVESIPIAVPIKEAISAPVSLPHADELASTVFGAYRTTLVRIETDEGHSGVGECMVRLAPEATASVVDELGPLLVGRDPADVGLIWELMYGTMMNRGHQQGFFVEAISGIDIALWDIRGKALGEPVYKLLGGAQRSRLDAYASSLRFRSMPETYDKIAEIQSAGFKAAKIKIGRDPFDPREDLSFVAAIREHVGDDMRLMVDANCGYGLPTAAAVARTLEELDIYWFEEPLPPDDLEGYRELRERTSVRIAAGETTFTRYGFRQALERRAFSIVQPNATRSGGISECQKIGAISSAFGIPYAPHTGSSSAISITVALHLAAALPNFLIFENMVSDWSASQKNPLRHELVLNEVEQLGPDGTLGLPPGPGLGIELNEDLVARYRTR